MSVTVSNFSTTSIRWPIVDFEKQYLEANKKKEILISDVFALTTNSTIQFALFYHDDPGSWTKSIYGIVLKSLSSKKSIEFDLKIWLENEEGEKFGEYSAQKQLFEKVDDQCKFNVKVTGNDFDLINAVYSNHKALFICCEFFNLNQDDAPVVNCKEDFLQNQWFMYEKEMHDAIVKVGDKEFKVMKSFLMAQSAVFEQMFTSNFKEGVTSTVNVKDVEEGTMMHLIKWFYTSHVEDDAPIEKVFSAADKYDVKLLKSTCVQLMLNSFDSINAFSRLVLAVQHNDQVLKEATLDFIVNLPAIDHVTFFTSTVWNDLYNKNVKSAQEVGDLLKEKLKK